MYRSTKISLILASRKTFTVRRIWNYFIIRMSEFISHTIGKPVIWGYPIWTIMEPTNACNLHCPGCVTGGGIRDDKTGLMDFENYKKVINEIAPRGMGVLLYFRGEPLLNPKFVEMVRYAKSKNLIVRTGTNAHLIDSVEKAEELVKSGLDWIRIPLDGITQETYTKYRKGGDIEKVKNATKFLSEAKKQLKSRTPIILIQFLVFKHNEHEIDIVRKLSYELGADHFFLKTVQVLNDEQAKELLPENPEYRRYAIAGNGKVVIKGGLKNRCIRLWTYYTVDIDGAVLPCCFDGTKKFIIGNAFEQPMHDIWKGEKLTDFRKKVLENRKSIPICNNCTEGVPVYVKPE